MVAAGGSDRQGATREGGGGTGVGWTRNWGMRVGDGGELVLKEGVGMKGKMWKIRVKSGGRCRIGGDGRRGKGRGRMRWDGGEEEKT